MYVEVCHCEERSDAAISIQVQNFDRECRVDAPLTVTGYPGAGTNGIGSANRGSTFHVSCAIGLSKSRYPDEPAYAIATRQRDTAKYTVSAWICWLITPSVSRWCDRWRRTCACVSAPGPRRSMKPATGVGG